MVCHPELVHRMLRDTRTFDKGGPQYERLRALMGDGVVTTLQVNYQVVAGSYKGDAVFQGLVLDSGASAFAPPAPARTVELVGDSITVGTTSSQNARTAYGCAGVDLRVGFAGGSSRRPRPR
ncbi:hypothetical protein ACWCQ0_13200 [Streptomyces massasporeus]|uniref:Uncharacterized protein n=1 Tax=Streptomyces massasporeus TaxID=67324 RepID=A0ABW6LFJ7_9ACTN